jgi:hypothetical protein
VGYGHQAIAPGGKLHDAHVAFLDWAGRYDAGGAEMRSRALHDAWLSTLPGAVLTLEGNRTVADQLTRIVKAIRSGPFDLTLSELT